MDWVTDAACRLITSRVFSRRWKSDRTLQLRTEFMNVDGFLINPRWLNKHLLTIQNPLPTRAQIYWWNQKSLVKVAIQIQNDYPDLFAGIELNIGCPSPKVMACWGWSGLMKDKKRTLQIIKKIKSGLEIPFSIKTRTWLNEEDSKAQFDFIIEASQYCDMITIHWRTLKRSHTGDVDRDFIHRIKSQASSNCKIIWNWGIGNPNGLSLADLIFKNSKLSAKASLDGFMIWQASIGNPRVFTDHKPSLEERFEVILQHLNLSIATEIRYNEQLNAYWRVLSQRQLLSANTNDYSKLKMPTIEDIEQVILTIPKYTKNQRFRSVIEFRKFLFNYVKWIPESKEFKVKVSTISDYQELVDEVQKFFDEKRELPIS